MSFAQNIGTCHRCKPHRQVGCNGSCVCLADDKREDIITKAQSAGCPMGYFGPTIDVTIGGAMPAPAPIAVPEDFDPDEERRRMQQGGCCGAPSA